MHDVVAAALFAGLLGVPLVAQGPGSVFQLEIPELDLTVPGDSASLLPRTDFKTLRVVVRKPPAQMNYGSIVSKINTESANIIMDVAGVGDSIICTFDLTLRAGFRFQPGRNSVEIAVRDARNRPLYASFLLTTAAGSKLPFAQRAGARPENLRGVEKYAVVVGVSRYKDPAIPSLRFADRDAEAMRRFLLSPEGGGFAADNVRYLVNEDATLTNVRTALFTFLTRPRKEDLVLIYFAGHGSPDPNDRRNLYLFPYDAQAFNLGGTAFPMWEMQDVFTRIIKARRIITFTDACHSAGISGEAAGPVRGHNLVNQYITRYAGEGERAVLTASDISETSREGEAWGGGHGVFTYFLLEGLKGKGDRNGDGTVTAGELFEYVQEQVAKATADQQNPTALPGLARDLPLSGLVLRARNRWPLSR